MVFASPKSIQATVTLLENLHIILEKTPQNDIRSEVLPLLFNSFESNTMQIQSAALVAVANVYEYVDEISIRRMVLPKIKTVFEKNQSDLKIMANVLQCVERILDKLDKSQVSQRNINKKFLFGKSRLIKFLQSSASDHRRSFANAL